MAKDNKEILSEIEAINQRLNKKPLIQKQIPFIKYHWESVDKYSNIYQKTIPILPHVFIRAYVVPIMLGEEYDIIIKENDQKTLLHENVNENINIVDCIQVFGYADRLLKKACVPYMNNPDFLSWENA